MSLTANLVGRPKLVQHLTALLSPRALDSEMDFIAANATPGMVYGWQLQNDIVSLTGRELPYVYIRESKKKGGQKERITGIDNNPLIQKGQKALIVESEEDPDIFFTKVQSSAEALRETGYNPVGVATILEPNRDVVKRLWDSGLGISYAIREDELIFLIDNYDRIERKSARKFKYELGFYKDIAKEIVEAGALEIRDIDGGEEPFLYSSGNWGPGYLMVKGLVGQPGLMKYLCAQVAMRIFPGHVDFVAGNVTGGLVPSWEIRNNLELKDGEEVPFVYVEGSRKSDEGQIIGETPLIHKGDKALVVEELVNFAQTTTNSAQLLRDRGYKAYHAATILHYENPKAIEQLEKSGLELIYVVTLRPYILDAAEQSGRFNPRAVADYRRFLENPLKWQADRGYEPVREGGTR
ncbi:MAG: hypothetical protein HYW24_00940 [Candidatus Aenigmarchaeota archaeon]|nr:hypothetical protein [Candidatus Aenigmarchaeota archaeon]